MNHDDHRQSQTLAETLAGLSAMTSDRALTFRERTGRAQVRAGGIIFPIPLTATAFGPIDGHNAIADVSVFPLGTKVRIMAGEQMDYDAEITG